jgi:hypothetical protein
VRLEGLGELSYVKGLLLTLIPSLNCSLTHNSIIEFHETVILQSEVLYIIYSSRNNWRLEQYYILGSDAVDSGRVRTNLRLLRTALLSLVIDRLIAWFTL